MYNFNEQRTTKLGDIGENIIFPELRACGMNWERIVK
jgi:hypothetical protein